MPVVRRSTRLASKPIVSYAAPVRPRRAPRVPAAAATTEFDEESYIEDPAMDDMADMFDTIVSRCSTVPTPRQADRINATCIDIMQRLTAYPGLLETTGKKVAELYASPPQEASAIHAANFLFFVAAGWSSFTAYCTYAKAHYSYIRELVERGVQYHGADDKAQFYDKLTHLIALHSNPATA